VLCQAELEIHAQPGSLSVYVHYGQNRVKDANFLAQSNVVITTYGVLASDFSAEVVLKAHCVNGIFFLTYCVENLLLNCLLCRML
jgi:hypothetical protein